MFSEEIPVSRGTLKSDKRGIKRVRLYKLTESNLTAREEGKQTR
jgi:hypothetical protein